MSSVPSARPAVFLDRDGTLNVPVVRDGHPFPPGSPAEFKLFDGVPAACRALHAAGYVLVVATNQPDVGRGTQEQSVVEAMHARLRELISRDRADRGVLRARPRPAHRGRPPAQPEPGCCSKPPRHCAST